MEKKQTTPKSITKTKDIAELVEYTEVQTIVMIAKKLLKVKKEVGAISKDSKNPFFNSKYFDINNLLAHVEPILHEQGLICLQPIINGEVFTEIMDTETGAIVSSSMRLPELTDPQKLGSAITYYRRYTLASLLALQGEDDDGNKAKATPIKKVEPPKPAEIPQLTEEQFKLAMESDIKGIRATINAIEKGTLIAKSTNQVNQLVIQLEKLSNIK